MFFGPSAEKNHEVYFALTFSLVCEKFDLKTLSETAGSKEGISFQGEATSQHPAEKEAIAQSRTVRCRHVDREHARGEGVGVAVAYRYQDTRVSCIGRYSYVCDFVDRTDPAARVPTRYTDE